MAVAIRIKRGLKANIESAKATLKQWEQVYATDTDEIGIYDGVDIRWQSSGGGATYTEMTQALIDTGTSTTSMVISPKLFKDNVTSMIDNAIIAGINGGY